MHKMLSGLLSFCCLTCASIALADDAPAPKAANSLVYQVVEVQGKVAVAPTGTDSKAAAGWTPLKVGDELHAGQQVRVSAFRSKVKFIAVPADPPTVMLIDRGSLVNFSELEIKDGAAKSRMQLNYGQIKAGVAEGSVRSDMQIESPVATLSKRGTDIFGIEYINGQYRMFLTDQGRGLIQAIQTWSSDYGNLKSNQSRFVTPGQFITHQLIRAIDNVQLDHNVNVNDVFGLGGADKLFNMLNDRGFGLFLNPNASGPGMFETSNAQTVNPEQQGGPNQLVNSLFNNNNIRPANNGGDFGIGQGSVPNIIKKSIKADLRRKMGLKAKRDSR